MADDVGHSSNSLEGGLSNHAIEALLRRSCPDFQGVVSADTIPPCLLQRSREGQQWSLICNLSEADRPGSHFISIICLPNYALYLDSLGLPCRTTSIAEFLRDLKKPIFYNVRQVQSASSDACGLYCMLFILHFNHRERSAAPTEFQWEKRKLSLNDVTCVALIREMLNKVDSNLLYIFFPLNVWCCTKGYVRFYFTLEEKYKKTPHCSTPLLLLPDQPPPRCSR